MHWFKRNIGDYHKKAGRLTMLQHGAYTLLMDSCYDREQFPTMEEAIEWVWASTPEEVQAVEFVLSRFFTLKDGVYTQQRIQDEIDNFQSKSANNKRIALEREAKRRKERTNEHETCTNKKQNVNESPPNQEPRTKNQEPIKTYMQSSACPHDEIIALYHEILPANPKVRLWNDTRKSYLRSRWREDNTRQNLDYWKRLFQYISKSDFLTGKTETPNRKPFMADLEWIVKPLNFVKIIEGKYEN